MQQRYLLKRHPNKWFEQPRFNSSLKNNKQEYKIIKNIKNKKYGKRQRENQRKKMK
jgi:hypothetical protein